MKNTRRATYTDTADLLWQEGMQMQADQQTAKQKMDEAIAAGFEKRLQQFASDPEAWQLVTQHPDFQTHVLPALQNTGRRWMVADIGPGQYKVTLPQVNGGGFKTGDALLAAAAQNPNDPNIAPAAVRYQRLKSLAPQYNTDVVSANSQARANAAQAAALNSPTLSNQALRDSEAEVSKNPDLVPQAAMSKIGQLIAQLPESEQVYYNDVLANPADPSFDRKAGMFASADKKKSAVGHYKAKRTINELIQDPDVLNALRNELIAQGQQRRLKQIRDSVGQQNA